MTMSLLTDVVINLRNLCPIFEQRVMGSQSFMAGSSAEANLAVPCAFVVPMYETADSPGDLSYAQFVTERFAVIVCLDNSVSKRHGSGMSAEINLQLARGQLQAALLGWTPPTKSSANTVSYARAQHLYMDNARLWHSFEWTCRYPVAGDPTTSDVWQQIEAIVQNNFPDVDTAKLKSLWINTNPQMLSEVEDPKYNEVLRIITDAPPSEWINQVHVDDGHKPSRQYGPNFGTRLIPKNPGDFEVGE